MCPHQTRKRVAPESRLKRHYVFIYLPPQGCFPALVVLTQYAVKAISFFLLKIIS